VSATVTSGNIAVKVNGTVTKAAIIAAINGVAGYSATATSASGDTNYIDTQDTAPGVATLGGGAAASGGLTQDAVFEVNGSNGSEVFQFQAGTTISQLSDAINLVKDATGVEATVSGTTLQLKSSGYGSAAVRDGNLLPEASGGPIRTAIGSGARDAGTDIDATVNGISATGSG